MPQEPMLPAEPLPQEPTQSKRKKRKNNQRKKSKKVVQVQEKKDPFMKKVKILQVESPGCIYVSSVDDENKYKRLNADMQKFYNRKECAIKAKVGKACVVFSAKDKLFCRAEILEVLLENEVKVFLCDYGMEEVVTSEDLQALHKDFVTLPAQSFKVKLAGILPCGGSSTWLSVCCKQLAGFINENAASTFFIAVNVSLTC